MEKISLKEFIEKYWNNKKYEDMSFIFKEGENGARIITTPYLFKNANELNLEFDITFSKVWGEVKNKDSKYMGLQFSFITVSIYEFEKCNIDLEIEIPQEED